MGVHELFPYIRVAVNLRMFEPGLWVDLPRRLVDGASY